jgi:hypothetical protein
MLHHFAATGMVQYCSDQTPFIPTYEPLRNALQARKRGLGRGRARHDLIAQLVRQINQHPFLGDEQKAKLIILTLIRQSQEAERDRSSAVWSRIKQFATTESTQED